ncbi:MAG: asparagine--tRNA ligase [Patescibacteria group bacterium]|nr:asparagine--tRNA ligase [Patescibacteria group bacterium]
MAYVSEISQFIDKKVLLKGWIFNIRSSGSIFFLQFRDGTGVIQAIVAKNDVSDKVFESCQKLTIESSVEIKGKVVKQPKAPTGYELQVSDLKVIQVAPRYPIGKKSHGTEFLMNHRHLWLRSSRQRAILRLRDAIIWAARKFFKEEGFILTDSPILTPTACEGTTTLFETDYFDQPAYLSQSGQLYIEATAAALGRVYDFGPTFRAEKSKTRKHLMEFWMLDAEAAFVEHKENLEIQENMVAYIVKYVLENNKKDLKNLKRDTKKLEKIKAPFIRKKYEEIINELNKKSFKIKFGDDFGAEEETAISEDVDKPVFVTHWPKETKPFYMKQDPKNKKLVLNSDLIAPESYGEIIGGSQREDDYEILKANMEKAGIPIKDYQWYLDLRKYGTFPHSGFGIGIERTVAWICGLDHIRETIPFPRMLNRLRP